MTNKLDLNLLDEFREWLITRRWTLHGEFHEFCEIQGGLYLDDHQVDDIYEKVIGIIKAHTEEE